MRIRLVCFSIVKEGRAAMDRMKSDIAASLAALDNVEAKTESGFTESQESRMIRGHNRAATLIQIAAVIGGAIAALLWGKGFFFFGLFVAWLFGQARLK